MKISREKFLKGLGYSAFSTFSLLFCYYLTFPASAVADRITYEVGRATGGKVELAFGDVDLYGLTGISAENIQVTMHDPEEDVKFAVDEIRARLQILPLLLFSPELFLGIKLGEGSIEADIAMAGKGAKISAEIQSMNLMRPPILPKMAGMPVNGEIAGKLDLSWEEEFRKGEAKASLTLRSVGFGPGDIPVPVPGMSGLKLDKPLELGQLDIALDMRNGRLRLASFSQSGNADIELPEMRAAVTLASRMKSSSYDTCVQVKLSDEGKKKHSKIAGLLDIAGAMVKKDDDGYLHIPVTGNFGGKPKTKKTRCDSKGKRNLSKRRGKNRKK